MIVVTDSKDNIATENVIDKVLKPKEIWRIYKNVVVLSLAFMLQFTAYNGVANLQSSINSEGGLGTAALAAVYVGLVVSSLFLPSIVISIFGCKWGVALSLLLYMPYVGVQMAPSFWTLIPAALLEGMAGGGLWCSKCTYLSALSEAHNKISGVPAQVILVRFFSIFYMTFQLNQVFGNLISSLVLSSGDNAAAVTSVNDSMIPELCGAHFLPSTDSGSAFPDQPPEKIRLMIGIYLACMACASLLVAVALDSKKRYDPILKDVESDKKSSAMDLVVNTMRLLKETDQLLMIPITIFVGMIQAFFGTDFTAAFVSCSIGTGSVGFVMMTLGVADAVGCLVSGYIAKWVGRAPMMTAAMVVQALQFCVILFWKPEPTHHIMIYGVAVLWGLCDCVWMVQVNSYYGVLFPGKEQAGYANFRLWESVGFIISYLISDPLRTSVKTYILLVLLFVGVACYYVVEFREQRRELRKKGEREKGKEMCGRDNIAFQ